MNKVLLSARLEMSITRCLAAFSLPTFTQTRTQKQIQTQTQTFINRNLTVVGFTYQYAEDGVHQADDHKSGALPICQCSRYCWARQRQMAGSRWIRLHSSTSRFLSSSLDSMCSTLRCTAKRKIEGKSSVRHNHGSKRSCPRRRLYSPISL